MTERQTFMNIDDPIVEEVRRAGDAVFREANYDIRIVCERLRAAEREHPERIATLPPRSEANK